VTHPRDHILIGNDHLPLGTYHLRPYDPLLDENGDLVPGSPRPLGVYLGQRTQVTRDPEPVKWPAEDDGAHGNDVYKKGR